ncbi:MAG: globin domain-containing protein [Gammaproteobacteria bacterium]|nr:globin domain-containing protein [Gammaproteobacteria bacterium]
MTNEEIEQVKTSWVQVMPISDRLAGLFYSKLFELDPSLRSMFPEDMEEQGKKLMAMINTAVNSLGRLSEIVPAVEAMGERHVAYGVTEDHYDTVGEALIWALGAGLGNSFTDEVKNAWVKVYTILADTMKRAAAKVAA